MHIATSTPQINQESSPAPDAARPAGLDLSSLLGAWRNTNLATGGIARMDMAKVGSELHVRIFGASAAGECDWGERIATTYGYHVTGEIVAGFELTFDFGPQETLVTAIHNRGVLVIHAYHRFKDGSGRANYISKEFFHQ